MASDNTKKLITEIKKKNTDAVGALLAQTDVDVHYQMDYAVRLASEMGCYEIVDMLIKKGADVRAYNNYAICQACENGHARVVKLLFENGAWMVGVYKPIMLACSAGHAPVVELLLEKGVDACDRLLYDACKFGHISVLQVLFKHKVNLDGVKGEMALLIAAAHGHSEIARLLLEHGADVGNEKSKIINIAKDNGNYDIVHILNNKKARVS